jgi:energy-coupling factor transporter ATP-binding protein EcfA2
MDRRDWMKMTLGGTAAMIFGSIPSILPRKEPPKGFRLGLDAIDDHAGGWNRGELVMITGATGDGKTTLAHYIARTNANDGHNVAIVAAKNTYIKNSQFKLVELPSPFEDYTSFLKFLDQFDGSDMIVWDGVLPLFQNGVTDLISQRSFMLMAMSRHVHERSQSLVFTLGMQIFPTGDLRTFITENKPYVIIGPRSAQFVASKIYKVTRLDHAFHIEMMKNFVDIEVIKNRVGPNNIAFTYDYCNGLYLPVHRLEWN